MIVSRLLRGALLSAIVLLGACGRESAAPNELSLRDAWLRATPPGATVAAGYLTVVNGTGSEVRIVSVSTPAVASVEMHESAVDDTGVMRMRSLGADGLSVPAGKTVNFAPGGLHLMLIGLKEPLVEGSGLPLTLHLADGSERVVTAQVRAADTAADEHAHH